MGLFDFVGSLFTNAASAKQASANRAFQEEMSDTAHQREVADLKAAGLNPLLSVNSGASVPSGSVAPVVNPGASDPMSEVKSLQQMKQVDAQTDAIKASAQASRAQAALASANSAKAIADLPTHKLEGSVSDAIINSAKHAGDVIKDIYSGRSNSTPAFDNTGVGTFGLSP